jgi:hypothetical protein
MQLAIAVICTGLAASLFGADAFVATVSQIIVLVAYATGRKIIDVRMESRRELCNSCADKVERGGDLEY